MIILIFVVTIPIAFLWVRGISIMERDHPDYKGEDLFEDEEDKKDKK